MNILQKFVYETEDDNIKKCIPLILGFYKCNKKLIPSSEAEDFQQDIIATILEAINNYDENKGTFATYLLWSFKTLKQNIISKYTGIKMNYYQYRNNFKKEKRPIKIYSLENDN